MDLLNAIPSLGSNILYYALPALFVFTVVVFFHELGHYWIGRLCKVGVEAFSIGFGKELVGYTDRHGTRWKLCVIPLGGYVKFYGDQNAASVPDRNAPPQDGDNQVYSLAARPVGQRAAVVAAGPLASFLLPVLIFAGLFMFAGKQIIPPVISEVVAESAAERAGLQAGDRILIIDGKTIETFTELQRIVTISAELPLELTVERGGVPVDLVAIPDRREVRDRFGNTQRIGMLGVRQATDPATVTVEKLSPPAALIEGGKETWFIVERTAVYLWDVVTGREAADQIGGPIRVVNMSGQIAAISFLALLNLTAVLSASIGLINLLPIPMLDGGHLAFYAVEAVRGEPLSERAQEYGFRAGLAIILAIFLFVNWNDINFLMGS